jgi:uroporphyrinogen decarboxylase
MKNRLYFHNEIWRDRINNFLVAKSGIPKYVPLLAQMHDHAARLAGVSIKDYFTNPEIFVKTLILASEYYQFEYPLLVYDAYNIEAEALGQKMIYSDNAIPEVNRGDPLINSSKDLARLKIPNPYKNGRMPFVLRANQIYKDITGITPNLTCCGPLTLAFQIRGYEQFILDMKENPNFAHELLRFITEEVLAPWIRTLNKEVGGSFLVAGVEAWSSLPLVTLEILEQFLVPYAKRLREICGEVEVPIIGLWGESYLRDPIRFLNLKIALNCNRELYGFDPDVNKLGPEIYKRVANERNIPLRLGFDANLICKGPLIEIIDRVKYYIRVGAPNGRFYFFLNAIPMETPPEYVHAIVTAVHNLGKYPLMHDFEQVMLPDVEGIETFEEYTTHMSWIK